MYKMKYKKIMNLRDMAMLHLVITNSSVATFQNDQRDFYDKKVTSQTLAQSFVSGFFFIVVQLFPLTVDVVHKY